MSKEITATIVLTFSKSGVRGGVRGEGQFDLASAVHEYGRQTISVAGENLNDGAVSAGGYVYVQNMDPTDGTGHFVQLRRADAPNTDFLCRILPGEFAFFRVASDALPLWLKADVDPVDVQYLVLSN